jgi:hypothetical protein
MIPRSTTPRIWVRHAIEMLAAGAVLVSAGAGIAIFRNCDIQNAISRQGLAVQVTELHRSVERLDTDVRFFVSK